MATYLQKTTEENLLLCVQNNLWGATSNKLHKWQPGDRVVIYVEGELAALFVVTSISYFDSTPIWSDGLYPHRVSMCLEKMIHPSYRIPLATNEIKEKLHHEHPYYGTTVVLNAMPLHEEVERIILGFIADAPDWSELQVSDKPDTPDEESWTAKNNDDAILTSQLQVEIPFEAVDSSPHTEMQYYLAQLGQSLHCQIWIPKADQGRSFNGIQLGEFSESELPRLPFNDEAMRIIRSIDVIWLQDHHPTHLFEVEHATSVYSGLLRMSDLVTLLPSLNIRMFICADASRREKVRAEVNRPTFSKRPPPLAERCRFISFDQLMRFMQDQNPYLSYFSTEILDKISEDLT